ncbi:hypothetical protein Tco_1122027 [Tanacetum coccineum]|uniref:Uncharacterized protein n=1 Tax=Tanacetum coccineum TaxID=301880 RepID=A0ABQ5J1N7_9ASTR
MAFLSSPGSTNEVNTANIQVSTVSTPISTASTHVNTANLSDATVYAFLGNHPNGSQLLHEDLEQIHEDDLEEMDLKWQLALLSMRARRYYQRTGKKITINGIDTAGYDKSKEVPTNMALMAFLDSEFNKSEFDLATYKRGLASVEEQLVFYKQNEFMFCEQIVVLKRDITYKDSNIRSQITNNSRKGIGFESYNTVPPPPTSLFTPPTIDLSNSGLEEFQQPEFEGNEPKASKSVCVETSNEVKKTPDASLVEELVSEKERQTVFPAKKEFLKQ